ncbi:MAG: transporter [Myxococcota bacterium]
MPPLSRQTSIAGIGQTPFTRGTAHTTLELHIQAAREAIADAGLSPADIDGVMPNELAGTIAEDFILNLGIPSLAFSSTIRTGGASFVSAIQSAALAIAGGVAKNVLLVAGRRGYSAQRVSLTSEGAIAPHPVMRHVDEFERPFGNTVASQWFAQAARRHMHEFGTTSEDFGRIAVAIRKHANLNPRALMFEKTMTLEQHQSSPMISDPLRLLDCSLETDGATAIVLTSAEQAKDLPKRGVSIVGIGEGHGSPPTSITHKRDMTVIEGLKLAAERAFGMAGLAPRDMDGAQIYDGFTWIVLASLEATGFCEKGEGRHFIQDGRIGLGGDLPINTSGGLLSEGHCSGANLVSEAVRQLRGEVEEERQIPNCKRLFVTGEGDFHEGAAMILGVGDE